MVRTEGLSANLFTTLFPHTHHSFFPVQDAGVGIVLDSRTVPDSEGKTNWIVSFGVGRNAFRQELDEQELKRAITLQKQWEKEAFSEHFHGKHDGVDSNYF